MTADPTICRGAPCPPYSASENGGTNAFTGRVTISSISGQPIIHDAGLSLLNPFVTGGGSISWDFAAPALGLDSGSLTQATGNFDFIFSTPVSSLTETLTITLSSNCTEPCAGDATINGGELAFSLVPEPSALFLLSSRLVGLGGIAVRRKYRA